MRAIATAFKVNQNPPPSQNRGSRRTARTAPRLVLVLTLVVMSPATITTSQEPERKGQSKESSDRTKTIEPALRLQLLSDARDALSENRYKEAHEIVRRMLTIDEADFGKQHFKTAETVGKLADIKIWLDDFQAALELRQRAVESSAQQYGLQSWQARDAELKVRLGSIRSGFDEPARRALTDADELHRQGWRQFEAGDVHNALETTTRCLEMYRRLTPGTTNNPIAYPPALQSSILLVQCLAELGRYEEAIASCHQTLEAAKLLYAEDEFPRGHPDLAECYCSLSSIMALVGDLSKAARAAEAAVKTCERLYPPENEPEGSLVTTMSLRILARSCRARGEIERSIRLVNESHRVLKDLFPVSELPDGNAHLAVSLEILGDIEVRDANFVAGLELFRQALAMRQGLYPANKFPRGHRRLASNTSRIGTVLELQGNFEDAEAHQERALAIYRKLHPLSEYPDGHADIAGQLASSSRLALRRGNLDRARKLASESLDMTRRVHAAATVHVHPDVVQRLLLLGRVLNQTREFSAARELYAEALPGAHRIFPASLFPDGHPLLFDCYNSLGTLAFRLGDYSQSEQNLYRAVQIAKKNSRAVSPPKAAVAIQNLATCLSMQRHFSRARELFAEALSIYRQIYPTGRYPTGHALLANTLMNLGVTLSQIGESQSAARHFREAATMLQQLFPPDKYPRGHQLLFPALVNLATEMARLGDYSKSRVCLELALDAGRRLYPKDTYPNGRPEFFIALSNMALICDRGGAYRQAYDHSRQSLEMCTRLYSDNEYPNGHPTLATRLHNTGTYAMSIGKFSEARSYLGKALAMRRRLFTSDDHPTGHPHIASSLQLLAVACLEDGARELAELHLDEAIRILSNLDPDSDEASIGLALCSKTSGQIAMKRNNWGAAAKHFEGAVGALSHTNPEVRFLGGHLVVADLLTFLAKAYHGTGRLEDARAVLTRAATINQHAAAEYLPFVSEADAMSFLRVQPRVRNRLLSVSLLLDEPASDVYRYVWWGRGAIQRATTNRRQHLASTSDEQTKLEYQDLLDQRREIAQLMLVRADSDVEAARKRRDHLDGLTKTTERLERQIADRMPSLELRSSAQQQEPIAALTKLLPPGTVFVDIRRYSRQQVHTSESGVIEEYSTRQYVAFVVRPRQSVVRVELGEAKPTDDAVELWRQQITDASNPPPESGPAQHLSRTIWKPIEQVVPVGTTTVLICTDGPLTAIPWSALPGSEPGSVLLQQYAFVNVPYGDHLLETLQYPAEANHPGPLLLIGDVDYDSPGDNSARSDQIALRAPPVKGARLEWPRLPGTANEAAGVAKILSAQSVKSLLGTEATTGAVLRELASAERAHFATHGFFADAEFRSIFQLDPELFEDRAVTDFSERTRVASRNPMSLSGLVLTGANLPRKTNDLGLPIGDGGILAAEVIGGLQLPNLDLVTLSACDTGLGDLAGGEGVLGLQRAFHIAGAKTVVASLWKVDDVTTQQLMLTFYENLYQRRMTKLDALRDAQLQFVRGTHTAKGERGLIRVPNGSAESPATSAPRLWAAWTLSGDWR
jgi:CHAT domain-containing protein